MALISNCDSRNTIRLKYIKDVNKYFPVVGYGRCFNRMIGKSAQLEWCKTYKFYISFENSICEDYITEKYSNAIKCGTIPIVMSPKYNLRHLIPGSYINTFDYPSPKRLGEYLHEVSKNLTKYKEYFKWKRLYNLDRNRIINDACKMILKVEEAQNSTISNDPLLQDVLEGKKCMNIYDINKNHYRGN
ncbi:Alpha-(1,3)-fucosyltransferase 6 [Thelohanellus kitauei]|uniref:Fucosyltransferase n=1 Tax=Thelohanellus kitauei TaxID=669202 RepID=A0A0C2MW00_THEKT|nr:Alpha-(1,3)-fucosyltransferase 6 [Thelohanellus kitauei]